MPKFRIFYFRQSQLDHAEEVDVPDVLAAIERATAQPPYLKAEIWSEKGKVGIIGASRTLVHS